MSEERAQYGEAEPLLRGVLRIAAGTVNFARPADLRRILLEAADENERLRKELENIANANPRIWPEETRDQFQQWAQSRARAALNHAAPAADTETD